jgi:hypothetical protein
MMGLMMVIFPFSTREFSCSPSELRHHKDYEHHAITGIRIDSCW